MEARTSAGATSAGVYDALLGGLDNFAADREAAAKAAAAYPGVREAARSNRAFLDAAVTRAAGLGIGQFLDLGCGFPAAVAGEGRPARLTHEAAGEGARVAYADTDPVVVRTRALPAGPGMIALQADLRDADGILAACEAAGWDLGEPLCVILGLVLQYFGTREAGEAVARYTARLAAGSAVIVSAWACDDDGLAGELAATHPADLYRHSRDDLRAMLGGLELVPPGITRAKWWPAVGAREPAASRSVHVMAAMAVKPLVLVPGL